MMFQDLMWERDRISGKIQLLKCGAEDGCELLKAYVGSLWLRSPFAEVAYGEQTPFSEA